MKLTEKNNFDFQKHFNGKRILVTGGTGLIGREVTQILVDSGASVSVVSLDSIKPVQNVDYIFGDLTNLDLCLDVTRGVEYVFHLAGIKGSIEVTRSRPASFLVPLLMFNTNILEASRKNGIQKLVYTSSIGAYSPAEVFVEGASEHGVPMDLYPGWAKRIAEMQIQAYREEYGLEWSVVRPCNVYGPGDNFDARNAMVIPSLMMRISSGEKPLRVWGDGSAVRDFAFSRDVAIGTLQALIYGTRGSYVNLGSGNGYTIKELIETLQSIVPFDYEFDTSKSNGFPKRVMSIDRAKDWIGYDPATSLYDGLLETWNWFLKNKNEFRAKKNYFSDEETL